MTRVIRPARLDAAPFYRAMGAEWLGEEETSRPGWNPHRFRVAVPPG